MTIAPRQDPDATGPGDPPAGADAGQVRRAQGGDRAAFAALYVALAPDVQRFLAGQEAALDRHQVDDATQETFLRLHRLLPAVDAARPLRPYVLGVARRVALELARRRSSVPGRPGEVEPDALPGRDLVHEEVEGAERDRLVHGALSALAPEPRAVLVLRLVNGLTMQELADSLQVSVPTARARLREAAAALTVQLERRGIVREEGP
ncbi:MAG: sigma-70 family RNA polymerase sigma factor [Planctomycetes bacterium]|nr:sigma-70 family RNA polymerase sigma factor [Planctomycetota bacterium]